MDKKVPYNTQIPRSIGWFVDAVFQKEKDKKLARRILASLPLPTRKGAVQTSIIKELVPSSPVRYFRVVKRLQSIGIIKKGACWDREIRKSTRFVALVPNEGFLLKLSSLYSTWSSVCTPGRINEDEREEENLFN